MTEKTYNFIQNSQVNTQHLPMTMIEQSQPVTQYQQLTPREDPVITRVPQYTFPAMESSLNSGSPYSLESKLDICIKEMHCLREDNQALKRKLSDLNEEHKKTQTKLLTEMLSIKRLLTENTTSNQWQPVLPKSPFKSKEEFSSFEDTIQGELEKFKLLENELYLMGIPECGKFVRAVWKRLVTDELACEITWKNVTNKLSLENLAVTSAFKEAYCRKFANEADFKKFTIKWFQTARDRVNYKVKQAD